MQTGRTSGQRQGGSASSTRASPEFPAQEMRNVEKLIKVWAANLRYHALGTNCQATKQIARTYPVVRLAALVSMKPTHDLLQCCNFVRAFLRALQLE